MTYTVLDMQMSRYGDVLQNQVGLTETEGNRLATTVAADVRFLSTEIKDRIHGASPVSIRARLDELISFQAWMDDSRTIQSPISTRAQVIVQNYICFVYLTESCFSVLRKHAPAGSVAKKCAKFLTNNPVRAFRNAVAHSNWEYQKDYEALVYWARKGGDPNDPLEQFEVDNSTLGFWQALSRCVAYSMYLNLE